MLQSPLRRLSAGGIPSSLEDLSLFLLRPSTDWMRPTHMMESNLLDSKSADLKFNHI